MSIGTNKFYCFRFKKKGCKLVKCNHKVTSIFASPYRRLFVTFIEEALPLFADVIKNTSTVSTAEREFSTPLARSNSYCCGPPFGYCRLCSANALRSTIFKIQKGRVIELPKI